MKEEEKNIDAFAEIASQEHPGDQDGMKELPPVPYDKAYFAISADKADRVEALSYEEELKLFHIQKQQLKEKFRPFLSNWVAAPEFTRRRRQVTDFQFRYHTEQDTGFARVLNGEGEWEQVAIPDFRGPTDFDGKWTGYYRHTFEYGNIPAGKRVFLVFKGVDYQASVYVNNKCVGSHEGFFAPFEFDVTDVLREHNTLIVEVSNDYPMMGVNGTKLDGDKMYAATGPGWDDPASGWHHCPPGAGIYNQVYLEERAELFIQDIFVRPNIDDSLVEVWIDVFNTTGGLIEDFEINVKLQPKNFTGEDAVGPYTFPVPYAGPGMNYYRYRVELPAFRLWEPDSPYLYNARVELASDNVKLDIQDRHFGMRKFHMDDNEQGDGPAGTLYFNNKPIFLRGANEMGHLQQCVMNNDYEQLIDDILIAKLANMNFYRVTQRPVQEEIYDYFDRLGMMHQCDLPTFGYFRRSQFCEGVRQAAEMERLIRSHPSSIMASLINEPSRTEKRRKGHRHLHRNELEKLFVACRQAIYIENPDRIVKNTDGDYNPPTREGMPDFHCYNMWYTNNMMSVGKMYKGYLPPIKPGWKVGCGEYGSEGLDNYDVMMSRYPKEWLPASDDEPWAPNVIRKSQTYNHHGDWYPEQTTIREWIRASQQYQSFVTKLMTDSWRRRADMIVSNAIHLLIDAWPSGWMKAIVGVDRIPKPAYFTYRDCLKPLRVNLRSDRWKVYAGETAEVEAWLLNDTPDAHEGCRIVATLRDDARDYASFELSGEVPASGARYGGTIRFRVPETADRQTLYVDAALINGQGEVLDSERFAFEAFAATGRADSAAEGRNVYAIDREAASICSQLNIASHAYNGEATDAVTIVAASKEQFEAHRETVLNKVEQGATAVCFLSSLEEGPWELGDIQVQMMRSKEVYTLSVNMLDPRLNGMKPDDIAYFYHSGTDRIEFVGKGFVEGEGIEPLVYSFKQVGNVKNKLPMVGSRRYGKGELLFVCLPLTGRLGWNPTLDRLLRSLINSQGV